MKYLFLLLLISSLKSFSQKNTVGVQNMYRSVGLITWVSNNSDTSGFGTGTIILKSIDSNHVSVFLVTCKHVLPDKSYTSFIDFKMGYNKNDSTKKQFGLRIQIYDAVGYYDQRVKADQFGADVVVMNISGLIPDTVAKYLFPSLVLYDLLSTKDIIKNYGVGVGDDILYIGYPSLFFDPRNISPILKGGFISTPPNEDYYFNNNLRNAYRLQMNNTLPEKLNGFLIDISATGGSSGSLVFLNPKRIRSFDNQVLMTAQGGFLFILGILATGYLDLDERTFKQKLNISGVVSSEAIKRTIDLFSTK